MGVMGGAISEVDAPVDRRSVDYVCACHYCVPVVGGPKYL